MKSPDERTDFSTLLVAYIRAWEQGLEDPAGVEADSEDRERLRQLRRFWCEQHGPAGAAALRRPGPAEDPAPSPLPERIGRFLVRGVLGSGGFGIVYLAYDPTLQREVAAKVPRLERLLTADDRARFQREARVAAALQHPNLVPVYEVAEDDSLFYLVTAYVPGPTLAAWQREKRQRGERVDCRQAARVVAALADGMQHAHERGVLHCDLKPSNVLLQGPPAAESFVPRITDFGLARWTLPGPDWSGAALVAGTPAYMAPEQAAGRRQDVTPRSDVYSLGVILYELLTGRVPFEDRDPLAVLRQVRDDEPPRPRHLRPDVPLDLEAIVLRCLEKESARRYESAAELARDLGRYLEGIPTLARPIGLLEQYWRWRRYRARGAVAVLGLLVAGVLLPGLWWYHVRLMRVRAEADWVARTAREQELHRLLAQVKARRMQHPAGWTWDNLRDLERAAELGPVGEDLATLRGEVAAGAAGVDLRLQRTLAPGFTAGQAVFSPCGRLLALAQQLGDGAGAMQVLLVHPDTGAVERALSFPAAAAWQARARRAEASKCLAFSPDGRWLVVGMRSGHLHRWDLTQPAPQALTWQADAAEVRRVVFSSDSRYLFSLSPEGALRRWDQSAGWRQSHLDGIGGAIADVATLALHKTLVCQRGGCYQCRDEGTLEQRGRDVPLSGVGLSLGPSGTVLVTNRNGRLYLHDCRSGQERAVLPGSQETWSSHHVVFSGDGSLLAHASVPRRHLAVWEAAGGRLVADVVVPGILDAVAFRPDGRRLAVTARGRTLLYEVAGLHEQTFAAHQNGPVRDLAFTGAGQALVCLAEDRFPLQPLSVGALGFTPTAPGPTPCAPPAWFTHCPPRGSRFRLAIDPTGSQVFSTWADRVSCWEPTRMRERVCGRFDGSPSALSLAPDGKLWAVAGHEVLCGRAPREALAACHRNPPGAREKSTQFTSVAAGRRFALAGRADGRLFLFDAATARLRSSWALGGAAIESLALGPGEEVAVAGTRLGRLVVVEIPSGRVVRELEGHTEDVTGAAFLGPDLLASASRDGTVRLWHGDGSRVLTLPAAGPVERLAASPDGARLAVVIENERAVRIWHLDRLEQRLARFGVAAGLPAGSGRAEERRWRSYPPVLVQPRRGPQGLKAELFAGTHFDRKLGERLDARVDFCNYWDKGPDRLVGLPRQYHSVRWTGWLKAPAPGRYVLSVQADNAARLWLDGRQVIEMELGGTARPWVEVTLTGRPHAVRLDYWNADGPGYCRLRWRPAGSETAAWFRNGHCRVTVQGAVERARRGSGCAGWPSARE